MGQYKISIYWALQFGLLIVVNSFEYRLEMPFLL